MPTFHHTIGLGRYRPRWAASTATPLPRPALPDNQFKTPSSRDSARRHLSRALTIWQVTSQTDREAKKNQFAKLAESVSQNTKAHSKHCACRSADLGEGPSRKSFAKVWVGGPSVFLDSEGTAPAGAPQKSILDCHHWISEHSKCWRTAKNCVHPTHRNLGDLQ